MHVHLNFAVAKDKHLLPKLNAVELFLTNLTFKLIAKHQHLRSGCAICQRDIKIMRLPKGHQHFPIVHMLKSKA